ncbi:DUF3465 domain-containing protein [Pseudaeromonas sharmana]|uniref:DUF3465 domain-containing protein n=1 Tax=Pseudaeromonas sharmana TaxID=328412 RepID=A0ABV8CK74_9GAMM
MSVVMRLFFWLDMVLLALALNIATALAGESDEQLAVAFANQQRNLQIQGEGLVSAMLPDDTTGSQHQRFILRLTSGQSLLIAHNIDLAPRIADLNIGDRVEFYGEYEWNPEGGVVHWTHHDPDGRHAAGWLRHNGKLYQ